MWKMSKVFIVDSERKPLDPIHPGWARKLLSSGQAAVLRRYPFTLILKKRVKEPQVQSLRVKIDPGSRTTGVAILNEKTGEVVFAAEIFHRGQQIKDALNDRRGVRRSRRRRKTRYRKPRFSNRSKRKGWLPPSLESRIHHIQTWVRRFQALCPITAISLELVRFDMQALENPDISGIEYQQGTLFGYELREYLLLKWKHACAYCGIKDVPLQIEHIVPRAKGGSNRLSNLCIACKKCNQKKGTQDISEFLKKKPALLSCILAQAKAPLKDAAAVNTTRWQLYKRLEAIGIPIECGSGGLTKYNRIIRELPKKHWLDAANVGSSTPIHLQVKDVHPLYITAYGHGCRQMCLMDKYGFVRTKAKQKHPKHGFRTRDHVYAVVPASLARVGTYKGRMSAKANGSFTIMTNRGNVPDIGYRYCVRFQRADGYGYQDAVKGGSGVSFPA
jgi:5-methylcytosine-specific restriction endonuclease McrA